MTEQNPNVAFTVKELFQGIDRKLDLLTLKLDQKADQRHLEALDKRVDDVEDRHDARIVTLEKQNASWKSLAAFVAGVSALAVSVGLHFI